METILCSEHRGRLLAVDETGTFVLLDDHVKNVVTGEIFPNFTHDEPVRSAVFIPKSNYVLVVQKSRMVMIHYPSGRDYMDILHRILSNGLARFVCITPNGRYIIGHEHHGPYLLWDKTKEYYYDPEDELLHTTPKCLGIPLGYHKFAHANDSVLLVGDEDNHILVWDFIQDKPVTQFTYPGMPIKDIHIHGDFVAISYGTCIVHIINIRTGIPLSTFAHRRNISDMFLTAKYLITRTIKDGVYIWRRDNEKLVYYKNDDYDKHMKVSVNKIFLYDEESIRTLEYTGARFSVFALALAIGDGDFGVTRKLLGRLTPANHGPGRRVDADAGGAAGQV